MKTERSPCHHLPSKYRVNCWRFFAWAAGAGRLCDAGADDPFVNEESFWRDDCPRAKEMFEIWWKVNRDHWLVACVLMRAVLTGRDAAMQKLHDGSLSRVYALLALGIILLPGRFDKADCKGSMALAVEREGSPYEPGCHQWLEVNPLTLTWRLVRDLDHHV